MEQLLNFLRDLFLFKYLPDLGHSASYGLLLLFGVLTSFHCIGMCGGIVISQCIGDGQARETAAGQKPHGWFVPSSLYNVGRILSYTVIGGIAGGLGHVVSFSGAWRGIIPLIGGIFMLVMGVNLLGIFPSLRKFNLRMPYFFARKIKGENNYGPFYIGLLSGLMPCGPLQIIQLYALGTGSVFYGAAAAFVFTLGTVPVLFAFGALNTVINKKHSAKILKASAALVLILGVVMIGRGLALAGVALPHINTAGEETAAVALPDICAAATTADEKTAGICTMMQTEEPKPTEAPVKVSAAPKETKNSNKPQSNIQIITTEIQPGSYPPIVVRKGIPVKWIIKASKENLNGCNNAIVIPRLKIEKELVEGDNIVEFTPRETGKIVYTCWMGMITSTITVKQ